ncbi:hypothetical protein D3C81_1209220 [compost metagenome]
MNAPAVADARGHGARQAAARRRAKFRLHAQRVDQRALLYRAGEDLPAHRLGPARVGPADGAMLEVGHGQDQRRGRVAGRHGRDDPARFRQPRPATAVVARHHLGNQAMFVQQVEVRVREAAVGVMARGGGAQPGGQRGQQIGQPGLAGGQAAQGGTRGSRSHDGGSRENIVR